jgi:hypothetical protein
MDDSVIGRMKEVEAAVKELDPAVRGAAFAMMQSYILDGKVEVPGRRPVHVEPGTGDRIDSDEGLAGFFADRDISKPADAVYAIAGYLYSVYGADPFTIEDMRGLASDVGLTVPQDPGATLRMATRSGKKLFRHKGGLWSLTTAGELALKEMFGINKGRKKRPATSQKGSEGGRT